MQVGIKCSSILTDNQVREGEGKDRKKMRAGDQGEFTQLLSLDKKENQQLRNSSRDKS